MASRGGVSPRTPHSGKRLRHHASYNDHDDSDGDDDDVKRPHFFRRLLHGKLDPPQLEAANVAIHSVLGMSWLTVDLFAGAVASHCRHALLSHVHGGEVETPR